MSYVNRYFTHGRTIINVITHSQYIYLSVLIVCLFFCDLCDSMIKFSNTNSFLKKSLDLSATSKPKKKKKHKEKMRNQ